MLFLLFFYLFFIHLFILIYLFYFGVRRGRGVETQTLLFGGIMLYCRIVGTIFVKINTLNADKNYETLCICIYIYIEPFILPPPLLQYQLVAA